MNTTHKYILYNKSASLYSEYNYDNRKKNIRYYDDVYYSFDNLEEFESKQKPFRNF